MAELKVHELPQKEQDEITAKLKELKVRGVTYGNWTVKFAKKKIEEESAKLLNNPPPGENQGTPPAGETPKTPPAGETPKTPAVETPKEPKAVKAEKPLKCHICRSAVTKGVCSGCGFTLKKGE